MRPKQNRVRHAVAFLVGLAMLAGVLAIRDFFSLTDPAETFAALCDACFVPGVLLAGVGMLMFVAGDGLFDIFSFGVRKVIERARRKGRSDGLPHTFYEYRVMKHEGRKGGFGFLLWIGGLYLVAAVAFLLLSEGM